MIDLLAEEGRAGFGLACALDIEGIPYRRIARAEEFRARVLMVAGETVPAAAAALAARVPAVIIGAPAALPRDLFGVDGRLAEARLAVSLREPIWPAPVAALARRFGTEELRIPRAPAFAPATGPHGTVLARLRRDEDAVQPAVVRRGSALWCLADLGSALANLLDERYLPDARAPRPLSRAALACYYRAPELVRRMLQRRVYRGLRAALARQPSPSGYPVDATGWLLVQLLSTLVRSAAGGLVRLARWPAPFVAAAALTHDLEPTPFAYREGLDTLAKRIAHSGHPATLGLVAGPTTRHLTRARAERLRAHDVLCHGLEHRGETCAGSREEIARGIGAARTELEARLGRPVPGFRSPRLDRSPDLLWALDRAGFRYDSSCPDVDRENVTRFGGGVRLNFPYRPPLAEGERVRPSACLELPVAAPDCIQPLFAGEDVAALRRAVTEKVAFVRATGGLYMGIVHAGVFGAQDAERRGEHLAFVRNRLRHPDLWLASASDVAVWWCARERVHVAGDADRLVVTNRGSEAIRGLRLLVESGAQATARELPALAAGEAVTIPLDGATGLSDALGSAGA